MKLWLICSAESPAPPGSYSSGGYREMRRQVLCCTEIPAGEKPLRAEGRPVYISSAPSARASAEALCPGCAPVVHEGLDEAFGAGGAFPNAALSPGLRAYLEKPRGRALAESRARAEALIALLAEENRDCVLFSHPRQLLLIMDALRRRGYCFNRTNLGPIRPLERILATGRDAHCGGCSHNCLLSAPGCGVGRDKAQRAGIPYVKKLGENDGTDKK